MDFVLQPCGILLVLDAIDLKITAVSSNSESVLGQSSEKIIGTNFSSYSKNSNLGWICSVQSLAQMTINDIEYPVLGHQSGNSIFLEILCESTKEFRSNSFYSIQQQLLHNVLDPLADTKKICEAIQSGLGHDRVFYCEFEGDGTALVLAETNNGNLTSLNNQHFSLKDLSFVDHGEYIANRFRSVPDSKAMGTKLIGSISLSELQFSFIRVRTSYLHLLNAMGITSSAFFSVVVKGKLKGVFGCHSKSQLRCSVKSLVEVQQLVEVFASLLQEKEFIRSSQQGKVSQELLKFINELEAAEGDLANISDNSLQIIKKEFRADTIICRSHNNFYGDVNLPDDFLNDFLHYTIELPVTAHMVVTDYLPGLDIRFEKHLEIVNGMIFLSLKTDHSGFIAFFRKRKLHSQHWDGVRNINNGTSIIYSKSEPWSDSEISGTKELRDLLLEIRSNQLARTAKKAVELSEQNREKDVLLAEIHHRVKNNLSIVMSILDWRLRINSSPELGDALREVKSRIYAIAAIHQTLYQTGNYGTIDIHRYFESIISDCRQLSGSWQGIDFIINVPRGTTVTIQEGLPLGLIVHEFIINSIKHAFQGRKQGRVNILWLENNEFHGVCISDDGVGDPATFVRQKQSLGLELIEILVGQLDGTEEWKKNDGVQLTITFPKQGALSGTYKNNPYRRG